MKDPNANVEMGRRPVLEESWDHVHQRLSTRLEAVDQEWWTGPPPAVVTNGASYEVQVDLSGGLRPDARGYVAYVWRHATYLKDKAMYDDRCIIEFRTDPARYRRLVDDGLSQYIHAFEPYRAQIVLDEDLALDDWEESVAETGRSGRDLGGRDGVIPVWPVSFYDEELCRRAFCLRPSQVVERITASGYEAEELSSGAFVRASNELLPLAQIRSLTDELTALLCPDATTHSR